MIPDTDEARKQLLNVMEALGITCIDDGHFIDDFKAFIKLINRYIAEDRAQGQEPYGYARYVTQGIGGERIFHSFAKTREGWNDDLCEPIYTHAQPVAEPILMQMSVAEIRAAALERAVDFFQKYTYTPYRNPALDLIEMAAKLRKGEPL